MEFRRSGLRDGRRRRVLMEDSQDSSDRSAGDASPDDPAGQGGDGVRRSYGAGASADRQPRITDLIPVRPWWCLVIALVSLCGVAAVEAAYARAFLWYSGDPADPHLAALSVHGYGTLATSYRATLITLMAVNSLLIYRLRRHKVDDYRARYRAWAWTAGLLLLVAVETSTGLHRVSIERVRAVVPPNVYGQGDLFWTLALGMPVLVVLGRILLEVRRSRLASTALLLGAALSIVACLLRLEILLPRQHAWYALSRSTCVLLAHWTLFCASFLYLRHVFLDAQDRLPQRGRAAQGDGRRRRAKSEPVVESRVDAASPPVDKPTSESSKRGWFKFGTRSLRKDQAHGGPRANHVSPADEGVKAKRTGTTGASDESDRSDRSETDASSKAGRDDPSGVDASPAATDRRHTIEDSDDAEFRGLSKAEKRRQRKLKRRQQRQS